MESYSVELSLWLRPAVVALVAVLVALIVHRIGRRIVLRVVRFSTMLESVAQRIDVPAEFVLPLLALQAVWQGAPNELMWIEGIRHVNGLLLIASITWLLVAAVQGVALGVERLHPADVAEVG